MKTKKKIIISLSVAIAVLLIAVVAIVAVGAATNQNITSKVKVYYKHSQQVKGLVSAEYFYGVKSNPMTTDGKRENGLNDKVWFAYSEKPTTKSLQLQTSHLKNGELEFSAEVRELILAFTFENTGYSDFTAYLDVSRIETKENIELTYSIDNKVWTNELQEIYVVATNGLHRSLEACYIKIAIANPAKDANFDGTFVWDLVAEED